ncbi:hypothetical protein QT990_34450, partial [Microcoleus sp. T3_B1]
YVNTTFFIFVFLSSTIYTKLDELTLFGLMAIVIPGIGFMENIMAMEYTHGLMAIALKGSGRMTRPTV